MLNTYIQLIPKSDNFLTKRHFFEGVSLALEKNDIFFSGYQIENKFRGLLRRHRLSKRRGDFFSKMNKIVSLDSTINDENYLIPASDVSFSFSSDFFLKKKIKIFFTIFFFRMKTMLMNNFQNFQNFQK